MRNRKKLDEAKKVLEARFDLGDWIFFDILRLLNDGHVEIRVAFRKVHKGTIKKVGKFYLGQNIGLTSYPAQNKNVLNRGFLISYDVSIDSRISDRAKIRTFLHEVLHIYFDDFDESDEFRIQNWENKLWPALREEQKKELESIMYRLSLKQ